MHGMVYSPFRYRDHIGLHLYCVCFRVSYYFSRGDNAVYGSDYVVQDGRGKVAQESILVEIRQSYLI